MPDATLVQTMVMKALDELYLEETDASVPPGGKIERVVTAETIAKLEKLVDKAKVTVDHEGTCRIVYKVGDE